MNSNKMRSRFSWNYRAHQPKLPELLRFTQPASYPDYADESKLDAQVLKFHISQGKTEEEFHWGTLIYANLH